MLRTLVLASSLAGFVTIPAHAGISFDFIPRMDFPKQNELVTKDNAVPQVCAVSQDGSKIESKNCGDELKVRHVKPVKKQ